jgi:hypothetical protein
MKDNGMTEILKTDREAYEKSLRIEAEKKDGGKLRHHVKKVQGKDVTDPADLMRADAEKENKARDRLELKREINENAQYEFGIKKNFEKARTIAESIIPELSKSRNMGPNYFILKKKAEEERISPWLVRMHIYHYPEAEKYESDVSLMREDISLCMIASALELAKQDKLHHYDMEKKETPFGKSPAETLESSIHAVSLFHNFFVLDKIMRGNVDERTKTSLRDSVHKAWLERNPSALTEEKEKKKDEVETFVNKALEIFSEKAKKYNIEW